MDLPKRGCLIKADGTVVSAWEWNHPGPYRQPVLLIEDADGNRTNGYAPDDLVVDLEAVTEPGDMALFYREQHALRVRKDASSGQWQFKKQHQDIEIDSQFDSLVKARRAQRTGKKEPPHV